MFPEPDDELWIGLNDFRVQMYFEWSDGTPVTYTKWHHGEPTHTGNKADCIVMKGEVKIPLPLSSFLLSFLLPPPPQRKTSVTKIIKKEKDTRVLKVFMNLV